jgi:hypothetical protein
MATGDITLTVVGTYFNSTIAAGVTGQNVGAATEGTSTATLYFVPLNNGQILVLKGARAA